MNIEDIELNPSLGGKDCKGNGEHEGIECQCDECDYLMECYGLYLIIFGCAFGYSCII